MKSADEERPVAEAIQEANNISWQNIEGWVGDRIHHILQFVAAHHDREAVHGDIAEIGVHHGKLFFIMSAMLRPGETSVAVDLFDDQDKNVDRSGCGSMK